MATLFKTWGATVGILSAQFPQSNGRVEAAIKMGKRIIMTDTDEKGSLDTNRESLATLQYHNTLL